MRGLRIVSLGVAVWGLSLLWPEVNQVLTSPVMMRLVLGLGGATLVYALSQYLDRCSGGHGAGRDQSPDQGNDFAPIAS